MGKWNITKAFDFCYGHRVWIQKLNSEYLENPNDTCLACRHLHGHQGMVTIELEGDSLNDQSMITDFKHLGWFKTFVNDYLDHKFIIDRADPFLPSLLRSVSALLPGQYITDRLQLGPLMEPYNVFGETIYIPEITNTAKLDFYEREILEGLVVVDFVPTSECLANWLYKMVAYKMAPLKVRVSRLTFNETPKTSATYSYVRPCNSYHEEQPIG